MSIELPHFYDFGPFRLDTKQHLLFRESKLVALTPKAFETLLVLIRNHGQVVDKNDLLKSVWPDIFVEEATLAQNVFTLRKALGSDAGSVDEYIQVVPKRGYRFVASITEVPDQRVPVLDQPRSLDITSVAVLPILDASADPSAEHLIEGLAEKIVNSLAQLPDLQVKACSTLRRYKRPEIHPQEVGRELGVDAILIGRVQQNSDEIVIRIEMVDVRNGWQLWGEQYNEKLSEVFKAHEAIAMKIADRVSLKLKSTSIH
jgi:DNA-binding winged helix-turn-helix (wHTH) protein